MFARFAQALGATPGITKVHVRTDGKTREICAHYDHPTLDTDAVAARMRAEAEHIAKRFVRSTWFVQGMESAQCAMVIEHVLGRTKGVLTADVAYAAERLVVEYDTETITKDAIEKRVETVGYLLEVPEPGHACSMHASRRASRCPWPSPRGLSWRSASWSSASCLRLPGSPRRSTPRPW